MRYISDIKKFNKIKEMAQNGDKEAKDFLFNFMNMDDEEANAYLSKIAINEQPENQTNFKEIIEALIKDENEAIDGYDKAIKYVSNEEFDENARISILEKLNHIKDEEIEHIEELKGMLS